MRKLLETKPQSNAAAITSQFLKKLNVLVTTTTVEDALEHHPDFPSLFSISDNLSKWGVENMALKVDTEKFEEIPTPFIAHSKIGGGNFILVKSVNGVVDIIDENGKESKKSRESFIQEWDNVVLLAERNDYSGETDYRVNRKKELNDALRMPAVVIGCLLVIIFEAILFNNVWASSALFLNFVGAIICSFLLWFEIDKTNPIVQQICSAGRKSNCTAVLGSKQAKIFNFLSWSEIGFFYFAGSFLYLALSTNNQLTAFYLLSWLNIFALPYTVFSVLHQWRVAKQWCPLCLSVQAVLVLQFVVCFFGSWRHPVVMNLTNQQLVLLYLSFFLPIFFWISTKKIYLNSQHGKRYKKELSKLKYNKEIFNSLLSRQKQITSSTGGLGITLGNINASNTIIKVCNPYCNPCAKAHPFIDEILKTNDNVKVQIIFTTTNDKNDIKAKPVKHLITLYEKNDAHLVKQALHDWYTADKKDYDVFAAKYILNEELKMEDEKLEAMGTWCRETGIAFTPTFFVNGYQLPEIYKIEDLKHLL